VTVTVTAGAVVASSPRIATKASAATKTVKVNRAGHTHAVRLSGRVSISGFRVGGMSGAGRVSAGAASGTVELVGPVSSRSAHACASGPVVKRFSFTPRNGSFTTASVKVTKPGVYTWVASTSADSLNKAVSYGCGARTSQTLVHRASYGKVKIETGFDGVAPGCRFFERLFATGRVSVKAIGMHALLNTVPLKKGSMVIPGDVRRGGWLSRSAAPGESVGSAVIAGHVSSYHDRPGAFGKLRRARVGQIVKVTGVSGKTTRYRITKIRTAKRSKGFKGRLTSTTSSPKLVLVTCTDEVRYPNGHFHYRKNLIVIATPIR
jgi:LPXTG-site transpeptidase (sortase) family protein